MQMMDGAQKLIQAEQLAQEQTNFAALFAPLPDIAAD